MGNKKEVKSEEVKKNNKKFPQDNNTKAKFTGGVPGNFRSNMGSMKSNIQPRGANRGK